MNPLNKPTLYKRKDSNWWWSSWYTDGKQKRKSLKKLNLSIDRYSKEEAEDILNGHLGIIPPVPDRGDETLAWLRDKFLLTIEREGVRETTVIVYRAAVNHLISLLGEDFPVSEVSKIPHVKKYQNYLFDKGQRSTSINSKCRSLRAIFQRLLDNNIITDNPFKRFKSLREVNLYKNNNFLTIEQINKFFEEVHRARNQENVRLFRILLFTGRRVTEILELGREDIDTDNKRFQPMNIKDKNKVKRWKAMPGEVIEDFQFFINQYPFSKFPLQICRRDTLTKTFRRWRIRAGLPSNIHLHSLRHSFVTHALDHGEPVWKIKDYLDHSTVLVTEGYAHTHVTETVETGIKMPVTSAQRGIRKR